MRLFCGRSLIRWIGGIEGTCFGVTYLEVRPWHHHGPPPSFPPLSFSRHRRLKLLNLRERKTGIPCDILHRKNAVLQHPIRRLENSLELALGFALGLALGPALGPALGFALGLAAFNEFFYCFAHGLPPIF